MIKPFDLKDLEQRLKDKGMSEVEDMAKIATVAVLDWVEASLLLEPNALFKIAAPVVEALKPQILAMEDKIDEQKD